MEDESAIEMFVGGLVLDPNTQAPVVVLKNEPGTIHLPIWIGVAEATSIASAIKELEMARPLTHDLLMTVIQEAALRVERVVITELKDSTYFSELILASGDKALILDARPSDAIAIALRAAAPIFVTQAVLAQAQITFATSTENPTGEGGKAGSSKGQDREASPPSSSGADEHADLSDEERRVLAESDELKSREAEGGGLQDFKGIDKDKWKEILAELDPDDFKYKT